MTTKINDTFDRMEFLDIEVAAIRSDISKLDQKILKFQLQKKEKLDYLKNLMSKKRRMINLPLKNEDMEIFEK